MSRTMALSSARRIVRRPAADSKVSSLRREETRRGTAQLVAENGGRERLDDVAGRALSGAADDLVLLRLGRHHEDRQMAQPLVLLDRREQLEAVHRRHADVGDDEKKKKKKTDEEWVLGV